MFCLTLTIALSAKRKRHLALPDYIPEVGVLWGREASIWPKLPKSPRHKEDKWRARPITRSQTVRRKRRERGGRALVGAGRKLKAWRGCRVHLQLRQAPHSTWTASWHTQVLLPCPAACPAAICSRTLGSSLSFRAKELLVLQSLGHRHAQSTKNIPNFFLQNLKHLFYIVSVC